MGLGVGSVVVCLVRIVVGVLLAIDKLMVDDE